MGVLQGKIAVITGGNSGVMPHRRIAPPRRSEFEKERIGKRPLTETL